MATANGAKLPGAESNPKKIRAAELFAGVGGFRIGLESPDNRDSFEVVWSNQWEPSTKKQHASEVYVQRFGDLNHSNDDIAKVETQNIPSHDLLVGGFPCQDYSVARTLSHAKGIAGRKGVLWWEIHRILKEKGDERPAYLMLENVDRLLKSPALQRGRDFAVMLSSLAGLGYAVEWRVINAGDYGMPQRRKRIFILGYRVDSNIYKKLVEQQPESWLLKNGLAVQAFPVGEFSKAKHDFRLPSSLIDVSEKFNEEDPTKSPFLNSGLMLDGHVYTHDVKPKYLGKKMTLGDVLLPEAEIPEEFFIEESELKRWEYLKGGKREQRTTKGGFSYSYNEGPIAFPDPLDKPSRTIITGEGGPTPSRFKHVIKTETGKFRRLTPVELERLCMFPDNHTQSQAPVKRAFFMGNALVVGIIKRLGSELARLHYTPTPSTYPSKVKGSKTSQRRLAVNRS